MITILSRLYINMSLCRYRDALGKPDQGMHRFRFGGVALFDLVLTAILSYVTTVASGVPYTLTLIMWLLLGSVFHVLFCVQTSVLTYLGVKV